MNKKYTSLLVFLSFFLILSFIVVGSYAHFTATVNGNNLASNNVITTGHMEVTYVDGNVVGTTSKMMLGEYVEKHFSVTNTGTVESAYYI